MNTLANDIAKCMVNHAECLLWARAFRSTGNKKAAAFMLLNAAKHRKNVEWLKDCASGIL